MADQKNSKKARILLVEDDSFLSSMYVTKLTMSGYDSIVAADGQEGFTKAQQEKPDLILLDIILPKMDGFEVLEKVKKDENTKDIPVVLLTNLGQKEDIDRGLKLGADDYLIKAHFTPSEVMGKIDRLIKK